ncbi:MFS transporter [Aquibacillus sediminis]|uniref:MFS transporter n=1 Tax=Aquibacillus sediminis TaxID=2574734 RepID=UPI0011087D96|nr:MFS transporter [Aquibacillus sediminis]
MSNHKPAIWTKDFISISLSQFMVFVAFYTLLTTLPIYVISSLGRSEAEGGLIVTSMLVAAIIMRPFSGNLLDKIGKKNGLVGSVILFTVTMFLYIWIDQYVPLLVLRFLHGLSFGVLTTATSAIAADVVPMERRGEGLGYFAMSMNLAVVIGPFLGLSAIQLVSFQTLFVILSVIMISGVVFSLVVNVSEPTNKEVPKTARQKKFSLHDLFEFKAFPIAMISGLVAIAYSSVLSYISVYTETIGLAAVASYFFVVFALIMLISRPYLGKMFDLKGAKYVIIPCLLLFAIGLVMLSFTESLWLLLVSAAIIGLGSGSLLPSFQTMCIQSTEKHRSGHATATFFTFWDSGIALGSYVLGMIVAQFNFQIMYVMCAILLISVMGLFMIQQRWSARKAAIPVKDTVYSNE